MGKKLIVYYSRTGNAERIANKLKEITNGDIERIKSFESYNGIIGWIKAGKQASTRDIVNIGTIKSNVSEYDEVIVVTPTWASKVASPVRSFLKKYSKNIKLLSIVSVCKGSSNVGEDVEKSFNIKVNNNIVIKEKEFQNNEYVNKLSQTFGN